MLSKLTTGVMYARVKRNKIKLKNIKTQREIEEAAIPGFTTKRLLVGEFSIAEKLLSTMIKKLHDGWLTATPTMIIHPLEMIEGGLSPVEERLLIELSAGAGARKVHLWVGDQLSDEAVLKLSKEPMKK